MRSERPKKTSRSVRVELAPVVSATPTRKAIELTKLAMRTTG